MKLLSVIAQKQNADQITAISSTMLKQIPTTLFLAGIVLRPKHKKKGSKGRITAAIMGDKANNTFVSCPPAKSPSSIKTHKTMEGINPATDSAQRLGTLLSQGNTALAERIKDGATPPRKVISAKLLV